MRSRPIMRSTIERGALPRRKPGTSTRPARRRNASSMARSSRSGSTSMASETWRGGNSVEETFTRALPYSGDRLRTLLCRASHSADIHDPQLDERGFELGAPTVELGLDGPQDVLTKQIAEE